MEKLDFINYRAMVREVEQLKAQLKALESSLYSPKGQQFTSTPRAPSGPKKTMDDAVAGHIKLEALYREKVALQEARLYEIEKALDSLDDPMQRVVMRERYVHGHSWAHICGKLRSQGYSDRAVFRMHGFALLKLKDDPKRIISPDGTIYTQDPDGQGWTGHESINERILTGKGLPPLPTK